MQFDLGRCETVPDRGAGRGSRRLRAEGGEIFVSKGRVVMLRKRPGLSGWTSGELGQ